MRADLEALFSTGLPNTPLHNVEINLVSGNFIAAQPIGIVDGVDHQLTGRLRNANTQAIQNLLILRRSCCSRPSDFPPLARLNPAAEELAAELAIALGADKLVMFNDPGELKDTQNQRLSRITPELLNNLCADLEPITAARCRALVQATSQASSAA